MINYQAIHQLLRNPKVHYLIEKHPTIGTASEIRVNFNLEYAMKG